MLLHCFIHNKNYATCRLLCLYFQFLKEMTMTCDCYSLYAVGLTALIHFKVILTISNFHANSEMTTQCLFLPQIFCPCKNLLKFYYDNMK